MTSWSERPEHGSLAMVRLMSWLTLRLGLRVGGALLYPISAYFYLRARPARLASRDFLTRLRGRPARPVEVFRHILAFSSVILDRLLLSSGRADALSVGVVGLEHFDAMAASGLGGVLLGAHLGSFGVLRALARESPAIVRPLMFRGDPGPLTRFFEALDPALQERVIEIGGVDSMLRVREAVDRGEIVGVLADRSPGDVKFMRTMFLGAPAPFPAGPMILAASLGVPVLTCFAVRTGPRRYIVHFEPFADRITLGRHTRAVDLQEWIGRYARRLEAECRKHPDNWFNFYDFWHADETGPAASARGGVAGRGLDALASGGASAGPGAR